jgi:hypothetical protein
MAAGQLDLEAASGSIQTAVWFPGNGALGRIWDPSVVWMSAPVSLISRMALCDPGHAQVDFGEALAEIAGVESKIHFLRWTCRTAMRVSCRPIRRRPPKRSVTAQRRIRFFRRRAEVGVVRQHHAGGGAHPEQPPI